MKWMETTFPEDGEVKKARERADRELSRDAVLSESWWDERMVWKWPVPEAEDEDGKEKVITLDEVVDAWPPWKEWRERVAVLAEKRGLKIADPWVEGEQVEAGTDKAQ